MSNGRDEHMDHRLRHGHAGGRAARHHQPAVREILPQLRARRAGAPPRLAGARSLQPAARPLRDQRALVADPLGRSDHPARHLRRQSQGAARGRIASISSTRLISQRLRAAGVAPEDVDLVLCTHLHADHVGWNTMLRDGRWVPTFPNAKYLFSRADDAYWDVRKNPAMATDPRHMAYEDSVLPGGAVGPGRAGRRRLRRHQPSCRSKPRPGIRPAMSCSGSRMRAGAPSFAATSSITRCRSTRRTGTTWRTSGRPTPRCRAGACWNPARSMMRCCFRSISARRMWWRSRKGRAASRHGSCRHDVKRAGAC